jgi:hypothetical protein
MTHVFISYYRDSSENEGFADTVVQRIKTTSLGVECWIDKKDIRAGEEEWFRQIESAIQSSFALIVIATPESLARDWVNYEWIFALGAGIPVIPAVFADIPDDLWHTGWHKRLDTLQRRTLTDDDPDQWQQLFTDLTGALAKKQGAIIAPPNASPFIRNAVTDLNSTDENEWKRTINALESSTDPHASHMLKQAAEYHHTPHIRHLAAFAHVKHVNYADIVWDAVEDAALHGDPRTRQQAWDILGNMGGHRSVEILAEALKQENQLHLRTSIIHTLGYTAREGESYALQPLFDYFQQTRNGEEKQAIIKALRYFKTDDAAAVLLNIVPNQQGEHLRAALQSLIEIGTDNAKEGIENLILTTGDGGIQNQIITYLGEIYRPLTLEILENVRNGPGTARARPAIARSITHLRGVLDRRPPS